jgi:S1-C subfamily serine protease
MEEKPDTRASSIQQKLHSFIRRGVKIGRKLAPFTAGVLAAFLALLLYRAAFPPPKPLTTREVSDLAGQVMASATPPPANAALVYQVVQPSLVLIQVKKHDKDGKEESGLGSGVIIDDRGDILTALHVVSDATEIKVSFADGSQSSATVANTTPASDIAVLTADKPPEQLMPATLGNPNAMNIGDEAYVVGNPFGLYGSMTTGVISGFNRTFQPVNSDLKIQGLIQIDAAVNPGNSGGPLLNRYGQVVGIVTGLVNPTNQDFFIGIGFAVPINIAGGAIGSPPD